MTAPVYQQFPLPVPPGGGDQEFVLTQGGGSVTFHPRVVRTVEGLQGNANPTTVNFGTGWIGQRIYLFYKQGPIPSSLILGSTIVLGTTITSYTATNTAGARDILELVCIDGFNWALVLVAQGFTV